MYIRITQMLLESAVSCSSLPTTLPKPIKLDSLEGGWMLAFLRALQVILMELGLRTAHCCSVIWMPGKKNMDARE